jgi:hypothetical protein
MTSRSIVVPTWFIFAIFELITAGPVAYVIASRVSL